jgi:hypothetical protein
VNVEIGAEAALFPEKEYLNGIFVAVCLAAKEYPAVDGCGEALTNYDCCGVAFFIKLLIVSRSCRWWWCWRNGLSLVVVVHD